MKTWRLIFSVAVFASGAATVRGADTNAVLDAWFAAQAKVHTLSADFVQTRALKTIIQPLKAEGHLWFVPPNQFRWELGRPPQTIAVRHGDDMFVIYPRLRRAEHYPLGASAPRQWLDTMALLDAGFPQTRREFEAQFQLQSLVQTGGQWLLTLQPRSANARRFMPELRISLTTNDYSLASTELFFVDGSRMKNDFSRQVVNGPLDENIFDWKPPADFTVAEPFAK